MIDGLKLTFSGEELRTLLEQGLRRHEEKANRWTSEALRTTDDGTEDAPLLPQEMCENEAERHAWHATVLAFIRDHIEAGETYRLGAPDLEYGELGPEKPGWMEQDEYEQRTRIGFNLERLVKSVDSLVRLGPPVPSHAESTGEVAAMEQAGIDETELMATRLDVEDGPQILRIEQK
jgi:hypothetical protein